MTKNDEELSLFKTYSAGHLFSLAKQAYERTKSGETEREPGKSDALVAFVFSAAALEAFINELADMANNDLGLEDDSKVIKSFASLMDEVEAARGSVQLKFQLAKFVFSGATYEKGKPPFQKMIQLFNVRNALVHLVPQDEFKTTFEGTFIRVRETKVLQALPQNILAEYDEKRVADWKTMISTQAAAKWACNSAVEMAQSVLVTLPNSPIGKLATSTLGTIFQTIK